MENLRVAVVQADIIWEDASANLGKYSQLLAGIETADVILLPETFNTGFTMNVESQAETMDGKSVQWMKKLAAEKKSVVAGSLIIIEKGKFFNRLIWVFPDGNLLHYNKRHLFSMGGEPLYFTPGTSKPIPEFRNWKFYPLIYYDLRFPI